MTKDTSIGIFLCCICFKQSFARNMASIEYKKRKKPLSITLYLHYIEVRNEKPILAIIATSL